VVVITFTYHYHLQVANTIPESREQRTTASATYFAAL
jgi:hypothetical protein